MSVRGKLRDYEAPDHRRESYTNSMSGAAHLPVRRNRTYGARSVILLLCLLIALAGCGNGDSGEEGHQFATDRQPTAAATEPPQPTQTPDEASAPTAVPTLTIEEALNVRGAPQFAYFIIDSQLQVYDSVSRHFAPVNIPDAMSAIDFASSPTGDRVGVLAQTDNEFVVQFFGADGQPLGESIPLPVAFIPKQASADASPVASPVATPQETRSTPRLYISWVPQGNAVVVAGPGFLQRVSMSGEVMPISRTGVTGSVVKAFWSPMDSQVAILTQKMDGNQGLFMLDSGIADAQQLDALQLQPGQSLNNLQWLPTGLGLVYVVGETRDGDLMNGQLYVYKFGESTPTIIATSGQGGPAATITHAIVSPDGQSVAYAVMVRDQQAWHLHSLWVKPVEGGSSHSIPVPTNAPITAILWTAEGLVWQQSDGSINVVDESLVPRPLGEEPVATPVASPEATPVATPELEATPRG